MMRWKEERARNEKPPGVVPDHQALAFDGGPGISRDQRCMAGQWGSARCYQDPVGGPYCK